MNLEQALGVAAHHLVVLLGHADGDQVGERFLGVRVALENPLVQFGGLVVVRLELQGHRFAEHRGFVVGFLRQAAFESRQGRLRLAQVQQADAQAELGLDPGGIHLEGLLKLVGGLLPAARSFQADGQVEPTGAMVRFELQQFPVAVSATFELPQLELDVPHGRVNLGGFLALGNGALQLAQSLFGLAIQVQRHGSGHVAGSLRTLGPRAEFYRPKGLGSPGGHSFSLIDHYQPLF